MKPFRIFFNSLPPQIREKLWKLVYLELFLNSQSKLEAISILLKRFGLKANRRYALAAPPPKQALAYIIGIKSPANAGNWEREG